MAEVGEKEKRFYEILENIFVGVDIEGKSGFINMMRIKSLYFRYVLSCLREDVENELANFPEFREELFDKLYNFFKRYFSESGSIQFAFTPLQENVWAKVYTDKDVALFWKTFNLYYVKTDRIFRSMKVEINGSKFFFDASEIEHRKAYEKKEIIYELNNIGDSGTINFKVLYSERGRKTDLDEIVRKLKNFNITDEVLEKAFRTFEKQSEIDYFINKDANKFLKEQFDIWLKNYIMDEESIFTEKRLKQLRSLRKIAFKIIDFISQFEDELRKIWEKPKFVLNSNYVITLDRIKEFCGEDFLEEIIPEILSNEKQLQEWKELLQVEVKSESDLLEKQTLEGREWKKLPLDTKYFDEDFKWKLIEKICENNDLDKVLDGWLIKSENWQALNTILPKFRGKVQTIYIDPPFNKEQDADYYYHVKYKDSTWITMLENRLQLAKELLKDSGSIFVRCDYNGNMYVRLLMNEIFGEENFRNEIVVGRTKTAPYIGTAPEKAGVSFKSLMVVYDNIYLYSKSEKFFNKFSEGVITEERESYWKDFKTFFDRDYNRYELCGIIPEKGCSWMWRREVAEEAVKNYQEYLKIAEKENISLEEYWEKTGKKLDFIKKEGNTLKYWVPPSKKVSHNNWSELEGYGRRWGFPTENSEILLKRVIEPTSNEGDLVMDFFLGSGTTIAVAHKLKRKWIGVEMGEHFWTVALPRMKKVLFYDKSGISKEKDVQEKYNEKTAGGFFKYYELEQYEQTLNKTVYKNTYPFVEYDSKEIYSQYVFLKDEKMLQAIEIDYENKTIKVDLSKLYSNIDIAETLSNLKGKWIKKLCKNRLELEDGEVLDIENLDWKLVKPLIWW